MNWFHERNFQTQAHKTTKLVMTPTSTFKERKSNSISCSKCLDFTIFFRFFCESKGSCSHLRVHEGCWKECWVCFAFPLFFDQVTLLFNFSVLNYCYSVPNLKSPFQKVNILISNMHNYWPVQITHLAKIVKNIASLAKIEISKIW